VIFIINLKRFDNGEKDYYIPVLKSAIKELSPIELLIMIYLYRYRSHYLDLILLSINHLVSSCGYIPSSRQSYKGRAEGVSFKFINALKRFISDELINIDSVVDIDKLKPSDLFYIQLNMEKIKFFANISFDTMNESGKKEYSFVLLEFPVMDKIIKSGVSDVAGLLYFYLYIKQFISIDEGKAYKQYALVTNDNLKENVFVSNDKLYDSFIATLQDLQLMYKHNFGYRNVDGIVAQVPNAYVLDTKYFKDACKGLKQQYKFCKLIPYENPVITDDVAEVVSSDPVVTDKESDIKDENVHSVKNDMNPFHEDKNTVAKPYKPFGGVFEDVKKQKSIRDMNDAEFFDHMKWMENQTAEDIVDDSVEDIMPWEEDEFEDLISSF
jgi:uncharacterized membrane protein